ncbi:MAG: HEAT repeat domain-containing protein, partial [Candidatus Freyarchaeota archaeon]
MIRRSGGDAVVDDVVFTEDDVERMKRRGDVEALISALEYKWKMTVRFYAARALGELGDLRAVEPLIQTLKEDDEPLGRGAAWAVGELGDLRAVDPRIQGLDGEDSGG